MFPAHTTLFRRLARQQSPRVLSIHGWLYRIHDGEILAVDGGTGVFRPWPSRDSL